MRHHLLERLARLVAAAVRQLLITQQAEPQPGELEEFAQAAVLHLYSHLAVQGYARGEQAALMVAVAAVHLLAGMAAEHQVRVAMAA